MHRTDEGEIPMSYSAVIVRARLIEPIHCVPETSHREIPNWQKLRCCSREAINEILRNVKLVAGSIAAL